MPTPGAVQPLLVADSRRARLLTALCVSAAGVHLVVIAVQVLLHRMPLDHVMQRLACDAVLLAAPLVQRWTGSVRAAAGLVGVLAAVFLPAFALQSGGIAAPMIVFIPLVPLLMSAYMGRTGTLLMGGALAVGLVVVATLDGASHAEGSAVGADRTVRLAMLFGCLSLGILTAYLHERERKSMEGGLQGLAARLKEESIRDSLTRLFNRRHLDEQLAIEMQFARRHGTELSVIMVDVDNFKRVNDLHGHAAGDDVLTAVAGRLRAGMRVEDMLARFGGEEFTAVLRTTDLAASRVVAERLRRLVEATVIRTPTVELAITISAGCASLSETRAETSEALLAAADRRLYAAKRAGRNRAVSSDPPEGATLPEPVTSPPSRT
jgi:diguanylate cyclase (GGDEF)-like protein